MTPSTGSGATALVVAALLAASPSLAGAAGPPPLRQAAGGAATDTLTLPLAVRHALELDPGVAAAEAGAEGAAATLRAAEASRLPSLSSTAQAVRFEEPMVVTPIHAFDLMDTPEFDRTLLQGRVELGYTLWDGGARGGRIQGARASRDARDAALLGSRQETVADVVEAYLAVLTARDVVAAQEARLRELEAERERVGRFLAEGTAPRLELLRAEAELSAAAAGETAARARLERSESTLASFLERPVEEIASTPLRDVAVGGTGTVPGPGPVAGEPGDADPTAAAGVLERHPALVAARGRLEAARARLGQSRAAWFPRFRASAAFVEYAGASSDHTGEWQAGLQVEYPLFTGGARSAEADRAGADVRAAEAEVMGVRRELRRAVDAARTARREALAREASLADAVARFEELARVEALALEEGVGVQRDFLRAQAGLLQARAGLAEARRAVVLAEARLARALGVLTPEWIDRTMEPAS